MLPEQLVIAQWFEDPERSVTGGDELLDGPAPHIHGRGLPSATQEAHCSVRAAVQGSAPTASRSSTARPAAQAATGPSTGSVRPHRAASTQRPADGDAASTT